MAVKDLMDGPRDLVVAQAKEIHRTHTSSSFARFLTRFQEEGLPTNFYIDWLETATQYRKKLAERDNDQRIYEAESIDVRAAAEDGATLIRRFHSKVRALITFDAQKGAKAALRLQLGEADLSSAHSVEFALEHINRALEDKQLVADVGLTGADIARAIELEMGIPAETDEVYDAKIRREVGTLDLNASADRLSAMAEQLVAIKDVVEVTDGEVPAFGFELLRAAAARRSAAKADAPAPETPPAQGGPGTGFA